MPKKRSKRTRKRQVTAPKKRRAVPQKRGYVWVRGPMGPSGRRKPGHFRKKPKKTVRKPLRKRAASKKAVRKPLRKRVTSKASEIRKRFAGEEIDNVWSHYYPETLTYHERWRVPPITKELKPFADKYGDINAHLTVEFTDKETGETVYRSTNIVAANEIETGVKLLDTLLNRYNAEKRLGKVTGFELWLHDSPQEFSKRGLLF